MNFWGLNNNRNNINGHQYLIRNNNHNIIQPNNIIHNVNHNYNTYHNYNNIMINNNNNNVRQQNNSSLIQPQMKPQIKPQMKPPPIPSLNTIIGNIHKNNNNINRNIVSNINRNHNSNTIHNNNTCNNSNNGIQRRNRLRLTWRNKPKRPAPPIKVNNRGSNPVMPKFPKLSTDFLKSVSPVKKPNNNHRNGHNIIVYNNGLNSNNNAINNNNIQYRRYNNNGMTNCNYNNNVNSHLGKRYNNIVVNRPQNIHVPNQRPVNQSKLHNQYHRSSNTYQIPNFIQSNPYKNYNNNNNNNNNNSNQHCQHNNMAPWDMKRNQNIQTNNCNIPNYLKKSTNHNIPSNSIHNINNNSININTSDADKNNINNIIIIDSNTTPISNENIPTQTNTNKNDNNRSYNNSYNNKQSTSQNNSSNIDMNKIISNLNKEIPNLVKNNALRMTGNHPKSTNHNVVSNVDNNQNNSNNNSNNNNSDIRDPSFNKSIEIKDDGDRMFSNIAKNMPKFDISPKTVKLDKNVDNIDDTKEVITKYAPNNTIVDDISSLTSEPKSIEPKPAGIGTKTKNIPPKSYLESSTDIQSINADNIPPNNITKTGVNNANAITIITPKTPIKCVNKSLPPPLQKIDGDSDAKNDTETLLDINGKIWDDDVNWLCGVCNGADGSSHDRLIVCEGCKRAMHEHCYLIKNVGNDDDWYCDLCKYKLYILNFIKTCNNISTILPITMNEINNTESSNNIFDYIPFIFNKSLTFDTFFDNNKYPKCKLCPNIGGSYKVNHKYEWCHVSCLLFNPYVWFPKNRNTLNLGRTDLIKPDNFKHTCIFCKIKYGACIKCSKKKCNKWYHITCGIDNKIAVFHDTKLKKFQTLCKEHCNSISKNTRYNRPKKRRKLNNTSTHNITSDLSDDYLSDNNKPNKSKKKRKRKSTCDILSRSSMFLMNHRSGNFDLNYTNYLYPNDIKYIEYDTKLNDNNINVWSIDTTTKVNSDIAIKTIKHLELLWSHRQSNILPASHNVRINRKSIGFSILKNPNNEIMTSCQWSFWQITQDKYAILIKLFITKEYNNNHISQRRKKNGSILTGNLLDTFFNIEKTDIEYVIICSEHGIAEIFWKSIGFKEFTRHELNEFSRALPSDLNQFRDTILLRMNYNEYINKFCDLSDQYKCATQYYWNKWRKYNQYYHRNLIIKCNKQIIRKEKYCSYGKPNNI